jgi:hypothetical protein
VAEAEAEPEPEKPVPVAVRFLVSLLFWLIGWRRSSGIFRLGVKIFEPATIGPARRAMKMTSRMKYSTAYRHTRLFLSFDCFKE